MYKSFTFYQTKQHILLPKHQAITIQNSGNIGIQVNRSIGFNWIDSSAQ